MADYEIGFGRPPKHTRFGKGRSGNPKGRPRGRRNLRTILTETLDQPMQVIEGGRTRRVSRREAIVLSMTAKAVQGSIPATKLLFDVIQQLGDVEESLELTPAARERATQEIIRLVGALRPPPDSDKGGG